MVLEKRQKGGSVRSVGTKLILRESVKKGAAKENKLCRSVQRSKKLRYKRNAGEMSR